jgi:hypothetical protein
MKYENEIDLLNYIRDIAETNYKISENKKWKNEWSFIMIEIDEFING